jgi:UDP-glucose 4-epimerase
MWLITGSRGYLGRHLTHQFNLRGEDFIGIDKKTGHESFFENEIVGNYADQEFIESLLSKYKFTGVVHLAALKDVSEAIRNPTGYLRENFEASVVLFEQLRDHGVNKAVFASSAAVYGNQNTLVGFTESAALIPSNAYGASKVLFENYLEKWVDLTKGSAIALRFFNLGGTCNNIGADFEGANLIPKILRSTKEGKIIEIFGASFPTIDGTAERDYIHVGDVVSAIQETMIRVDSEEGFDAINIGTGVAISVIDVVKELEVHLGSKIAISISNPREGDSFSSIANIAKARDLLRWEPQFEFKDIVASYFDLGK